MENEHISNSSKANLSFSIEEIKTNNLEIQEFKKRIIELEKENTKLKEENVQLKEKAFTDNMTGLYNRSFGEEELRRQCLVKKPRQDLSIALIDIEGFKIINDLMSYEMGDDFLKKVALGFKNTIRDTDTAIRWGGDEFLLILPNSGKEQKEKIRERIKNVGKENKINLTIGIATIEANKDNKFNSIEEFVNEAEKELKANKSESSREKLARVYC